LNYLLQSAGAICCKQWLVMSYSELEPRYTIGLDWQPLGFIHDEVQVSCRDGIQEDVMSTLTTTMPKVSDVFKLNVPLAAKASAGQSWADTH
jgi:DNA polymerase I-like protein with 3'-5' exonuclease and polymerase domains